MGEEVKVRVENLTKCFGDLRVLDKVSFQIKKGEFVCNCGSYRLRKDNVFEAFDKAHRADVRRNIHRR